MSSTTTRPDRYSTSHSFTTKLLLAVGALVIVVLAGWLCWAIWFHSDSKVTSTLGVNFAQDDNHYAVNVEITPSSKVVVSSIRCQVSAVAKDGSVVGGPENWTPKQAGANTFTITTTRRAVYLDWEGCNAPGQDDLR